jgi:hypothetical protein
MTRYDELVELAHSAAHNAHAAAHKRVAAALWEIAQEYQAKAGELGKPPDIGDPPAPGRQEIKLSS